MNARVPLSFYLLELKKMVSYRVDFWLSFLGNAATQFGVAFFLWKAIFTARGVDRMEGYTFGGLMMYYLLSPLVGRSVFGQEMGFVSGEIYDGGLTRYLLYPISYFRVKYAANLAQVTLNLTQLIVTLTVVLIVFRQPLGQGLRGFAMALPAMLLAGVLHFTITCCLEMTAFWADNVWSILVFNRMITGLLGGGMIPLAFFPARVRATLEYLPFPRFLSFPIRCLLGQVGGAEWLRGMGLAAAWAFIFASIGAFIWRRGIRSYSGVGI